MRCTKTATQVHHSKYTKENLTGESLEFLHPVCHKCHESAEFLNGKKVTVAVANQRLGITNPKMMSKKRKSKALKVIRKLKKNSRFRRAVVLMLHFKEHKPKTNRETSLATRKIRSLSTIEDFKLLQVVNCDEAADLIRAAI